MTVPDKRKKMLAAFNLGEKEEGRKVERLS